MSKNFKQTIFVNALINDEKQRVLMVRRSGKDHFLPGYLELPGGRVNLGESLEKAMKRKLQQDLQVESSLPLYFNSYADVNKHGPYIRTVFEVSHRSEDQILLMSSHSEYVWADSGALKNDKIATHAKRVLKDYFGQMQSGAELKDDGKLLTIYADGGSRGNPGPSASGFVIYDNQKRVVQEGGAYIGVTTNNQAEYTAAELALEAAATRENTNVTSVNFYLDSLLVVNQMNGKYKIKNRELWPVHQRIRELIKLFKQVEFVHIPREQNTVADAKVNQLLDARQ
jgi:ribonuclease HI/ADP-ribose pyrophosphatase YjhB (NUDIX family)